MKLTPELVHGFAGSILSPRFDQPKPTPDCHLDWWADCCSDHPFVAIAAPRNHAKSTAITHCYTLAAVLFKERKFVLLVSDTYEQAVAFLGDIKLELQDNEVIDDFFGVMTFEKDAENDIIVRMEDGHRFRIVAKGSEQKVRGIKWNGARPDLIIGDDLENDEIVMNPDRRAKFREWFMKALLPARSKGGIVRIVGTILHQDSLLENVMPKRTGPNREFTVDTPLKMYSTLENPTWKSSKYRAHSSDFKEILWPERWPKKELIAERNKYIEIGNPEGYVQEYLNEPIDEARAFFRRGDMQPMDDDDLKAMKNRRMTFYMAVDFAIGEKERRDYTAMVVGGVDEFNMLHIVDVVRERLDAQEIIDAMFMLNARWQPDIITLEAGAIEKAIGPFLKAEMFASGEFMNLHTETPTKDKESRARSIQGRMRAGGVKFNKRTEWYPDLELEMLSFPRGVHNDQVDAMAWLGLTLNKMTPAESWEEIQDREYEDMLEESGHWDEGRNYLTGY